MLHERTRVEGDIAYLTLTKGYTAIVDAADAGLVGVFPWYANIGGGGGVYAMRCLGDGSGGSLKIRLHRSLMVPPPGFCVDHINGLTLDNRRSNLRIVTQAENCLNRKARTDNKSGLKGVSFKKATGSYHSRITFKGVTRFLGEFDNALDAHLAYREAAQELHGEFARFA